MTFKFLAATMALCLIACSSSSDGGKKPGALGAEEEAFASAKPKVAKAEIQISGDITRTTKFDGVANEEDVVTCYYSKDRQDLNLGAFRYVNEKSSSDSFHISLNLRPSFNAKFKIGARSFYGKAGSLLLDLFPEKGVWVTQDPSTGKSGMYDCDIEVIRTGGIVDLKIECPEVVQIAEKTNLKVALRAQLTCDLFEL